MSAIVEASRIHKSYRVSSTPNEVLKGLDLSIEKGEFVALVAPSGEGKSTLLHILSALDTPDSGRVMIDGHNVTAMDEERRTIFRRDRIGVVFQFFNLVPTLTAAENVALPLRIASQRGMGGRVHELMDRLKLHGLEGHRPNEISGGEQQRIAIARALITKPAIVVADEPTGNLDFATAHEVMSVLDEAHQEGQTVIMATHSARSAAFANRVVVLLGGQIVDDFPVGDPRDVGALVSRLETHGL